MKIEELKISVDLARVITKEDIPEDSEITITKVTENETVLNYTRSCTCCNETMNLHQFLNKCKKWAINNKFGIMTMENEDGLSIKLFIGGLVTKEFPPTVPEQAIINYCEWILNYKEKGMSLSDFKNSIKEETIGERYFI
ncbi:hypothetical protein ACN9KI_03570 [Aliarcobacter butzleri]|uniref:hypothetical protein n=1 Tax=Aliarcobacter butzleri TaxID=28197 RepID=UPI0015877F9A|nr:hypothetical protein [Aliarcobacter butzleri]NUW25065.1 hypothetical protein [Aliarcobacter butzleri]